MIRSGFQARRDQTLLRRRPLLLFGTRCMGGFATCFLLLILDQVVLEHVAAEPAFEKMFESSSPKQWFASVLAGAGAEWTAAGRELLVVGDGAHYTQVSLAGTMIAAFGTGADGTAYAVGANGSIWRRVSSQDWRLEHRVGQVAGRHKGLDNALLVGVGVFSAPSGPVAVAYGPGRLVFVRDGQGAWAPPVDQAEAERLYWRAQTGPPIALPPLCDRAGWTPLDSESGLVTCHDRRALVVWHEATTTVARLPAACSVPGSVARRGSELFIECGDQGRVFQLQHDMSWHMLPTPKGVRALSANDRCLFAVTERAVWRTCL